MPDDVHVPVLLDEAVAALAVRPRRRLRRRHVRPRRPRAGDARAPRARPAGWSPSTATRPPRPRRASSPPTTPVSFSTARGSPNCPTSSPRSRRDGVDGVLLDLGISSPQIDDAARGFSFRHDGPLDMRMDPSRGESAAEFIARATVRELTGVIRDYGEERFAQSIARAIAAARAREPIVRTRQLRQVVAEALGARTRGDWGQDPATRTFQALRIFVNAELSEVTSGAARASCRCCARAGAWP